MNPLTEIPPGTRSLFIEWLTARSLKQRSIENYLFYFDRFPWPMQQASVDKFIATNDHTIARAFVQNFKRFALKRKAVSNYLELSDLEVPESAGKKKLRIHKVLSESDVKTIAAAMGSQRNRLMLLLTFYGGLRLSELIAVKPWDFQWKSYWANKDKPGELYTIGKGDKQRIVILPNWLMEEVEAWIKQENARHVKDPSAPIFQISTRRWQQLLSEGSKKGLGFHVNPHLLRHSCATWMITNGVPIEQVKEFLGHDSIATTQEYTHISKDLLKKSYERISVGDR